MRALQHCKKSYKKISKFQKSNKKKLIKKKVLQKIEPFFLKNVPSHWKKDKQRRARSARAQWQGVRVTRALNRKKNHTVKKKEREIKKEATWIFLSWHLHIFFLDKKRAKNTKVFFMTSIIFFLMIFFATLLPSHFKTLSLSTT